MRASTTAMLRDELAAARAALREIIDELGVSRGLDDEPTGTIDCAAHIARAALMRVDGALGE